MLATLLQKIIIAALTSTICTAPVVDFGSVSPVGGGRYYISGSGITSTATSITVRSLKYPVSDLEITMEHFGDEIGYATLEPGSETKIEFISFTGITQNSGGSATLTGVSRGLAPYSPYNASTTYAQAHPGGSRIIFSNSPAFYDHYTSERNDELIQGDWTFSATSTPQYNQAPTFTTQSYEFATVDFVEDTANQGAATGTQQVGGIAELAERHEANTATGESGYNLVLPASIATTTREVATSSVMMSDVLGYISQTFFNFSTLWSFGSTTHNASSTFSSNVWMKGPLVIETIGSVFASSSFTGTSTFAAPPHITENTPTDSGQAANKKYVDDNLSPFQEPVFSTSTGRDTVAEWASKSMFLLAVATTSDTTTAAAYEKQKEFTTYLGGTFIIYFEVSSGTGTTCKYTIYRNGSAVGTERTITGSTPWTAYKESISGWSPSDNIQLYAYRSDGASDCYSRDMYIYGAFMTVDNP